VAKPDKAATSLYVPASRFRKRKPPVLSVVVVRVPMVGPLSVTLAPGRIAPDSSTTLP
jgi:hypothetical protein